METIDFNETQKKIIQKINELNVNDLDDFKKTNRNIQNILEEKSKEAKEILMKKVCLAHGFVLTAGKDEYYEYTGRKDSDKNYNIFVISDKQKRIVKSVSDGYSSEVIEYIKDFKKLKEIDIELTVEGYKNETNEQEDGFFKNPYCSDLSIRP